MRTPGATVEVGGTVSFAPMYLDSKLMKNHYFVLSQNKVRENVANTCYLPPPPLQTHPKWFCKSGLTEVQCRRLTKGSALSRIFEGWPKGSANWKLCTFEGWPKGSGAGVMHITPCLYAFTSFQFRPHCVARNFVDCLPMTWKFPIWVRSMRQRHTNSVSIRLKFTGNTFKSSESTKRHHSHSISAIEERSWTFI